MNTRTMSEFRGRSLVLLSLLTILPAIARSDTDATTDSPAISTTMVTEGEVTYPIDLATSLTLAQSENLQIASARERIRQAAAQYRGAKSLWLPSIRSGVTWGYHSGTLQESRGRVLNTDRYSLQAGAGAAAFGAGPPMLPGIAADFHLADALFLPLAARRQWASRQAASQAATNDTLLDVAVRYLDLLRAAQDQSIASDIEQKTRELSDLTHAYATSGQGLASDADRMRAELSQRQIETVRSEEGMAVTSARLAQVLRLDPSVQLAPTDLTASPLDVVSSSSSVEDLTNLALSQRPELREHQNLVGEAQARLQREQYAPLVPTLSVGASYGAFGGKEYGEAERYDDRTDVQAIAYWQVRNLGLGDVAAKQERRSLVTQAQYRCQATRDLVKREVAEAAAQVDARRRQIILAESNVAAAQASFDKNLDRIKGAQGLPIEVLQSLQALAQARREYLRVVTDFNVAQFHLQRATGQLVQSTPANP
jgi:outer membrane protein TolC